MESFLDFEPLTPQLPSITVPTMILNGEFDFLTPRALHETLRVQIPNSSLVIIPRSLSRLHPGEARSHGRFACSLCPGRSCRPLARQQGGVDRAGRSGRHACPVSSRLRSSARDPRAGNGAMSEFFGPLDSDGRVPPRQQTRVAAFLVSAHGALARQFAFALPLKLEIRLADRIECAVLPRNRDCLPAAAGDLLGARPRLGLYGCILGNGMVSRAGRRDRRSILSRWRPISRRSLMPFMPASGRRPCCRWKPMRRIPS